jgi:Type IV secretion system pilin
MKLWIVQLLVLALFVVPLYTAFTPGIAFAQDIVSCDGGSNDPCNWCTLITMVDNVLDWLFIFFTLAAVMMVMIVGFKLVMSAGNSSQWEESKGMFTNLVIGFVIFLSAWLIVDTILKGLIDTDSDFGVWNELGDCNVTGR